MLRSVLVALMSLLFAQAGWADNVSGPETLTVTVDKVRREQWPQRIQAAGTIRPWQEALVSAEAGGLKVTSVEVDVGDVVKRGQVLARLATESTEAAIAEGEARVAQADIALEEARGDAARSRVMKQSGALSQQQSEQYRLREKTAEANHRAAVANLAGLRVRLTQTRVTAPDDGVITERKVILGQVVQAGNELFRMIRQGRLDWFTEVTLEQYPLVKTGQKAFLLMPDQKPIVGTVRVIHPQLTVGALVGNVVITLPPEERLRSGMLAYGFIQGDVRSVLTVPARGVSWRDGKAYVFVCSADNQVSLRAVQPGQTQGERTEILDGVTETDEVVDAGAAYLSDGDHVRRPPQGQPVP